MPQQTGTRQRTIWVCACVLGVQAWLGVIVLWQLPFLVWAPLTMVAYC